jgi:SpoVK/Ycf46/Vps4 family AAA+-type ATPase
MLSNPKFRELWPKGFMLYGPTGTGKTEMARYTASMLGWPLYRLDMGTLYSRWQGESERNLSRVLSFISGQGESVFLLDESEKLFGNEAVGQASLTTLLSMLLWWLQGETNRTITVMTSNKLEVIPPELYRPGRLDAVHELRGLETADQLKAFQQVVAVRLADTFDLDPDSLSATVKWQGQPISQAAIVAQLRAEAKKMLVEGDS